uniref:Uncharacterized protein n=1 Tax=Avena sativa TaxID=4498 RepID=A0ACD5TRT2_AVESA
MEGEMSQVLNKLADLLAARAEAPGSGTREVSQVEVNHKLELMPNEVKLEGVGNYLSWSRRGLRILRTKDIEGYVLGKDKAPEDEESVKWRKWSATDSLVLTWLLNSLTPSVAASVEALSTAAEVWKALEEMYSGKGNIMLISQIEDKVHDLVQGNKPVMTYVGELKQLWADLDHLNPLKLEHVECVATANKWIEGKRVLKFLKGLHPAFEGRKATLLHQTTLPSLQEAIAAVAQEESRLRENIKE